MSLTIIIKTKQYSINLTDKITEEILQAKLIFKISTKNLALMKFKTFNSLVTVFTY